MSEDRLEELKALAKMSYPTETVTDTFITELAQWAVDEIELLRRASRS